MEEMTIKEKAKCYDKAINKLRRLMEQGVDHLITRADVQDFFPELKESEDERIMKWIIRDIKQALEDNVYNGESIDSAKEALAWLEKQGKKGTNGNEREIPFSAWSEEDEINRDLVYNALNQVYDMAHNKKLSDWINNRILFIQNTWKPSEEQMKVLDAVIDEYNGYPEFDSLVSLKSDLKKLREE